MFSGKNRSSRTGGGYTGLRRGVGGSGGRRNDNDDVRAANGITTTTNNNASSKRTVKSPPPKATVRPNTSTTTTTNKNSNRFQKSPFKENVPTQSSSYQSIHRTTPPKKTPSKKAPSLPPTTTATAAISTTFSQSELTELTNAFNLIDVYGTGSILVRDLRNVLETILHEDEQQQRQQPPTLAGNRIRTIIEKLVYMDNDDNDENDDNNDESSNPAAALTIDDFLQLMESTTIVGGSGSGGSVDSGTDDVTPGIFDMFDSDGKGYITIDDLRRISYELGEQMSEEELEEMIRRATMNVHQDDTNNDRDNNSNSSPGRVTLEDFQRILQTNFTVPIRNQQEE